MVNRMNKFEKEKTDVAWGKLMSRLQEDNLLVKQNEYHSNKHNAMSFTKTKKVLVAGLSLAAMIAVLFLLNISFFKNEKNNVAMILEKNNESSSLVTTLSDGSIVYLAKYRTIAYPKVFSNKTRNVNLKGEAFFDVAKNRNKPFIITTPEAIIEVLGTSFSITKNENIPFRLVVRSGKVKVTDRKTNQIVYVEKNEGVSLSSGRLESFISNENPIKNFVKDFRFKDQNLKSIVEALNSISSDGKIELSGNIDNRILTVAFSGENIDEMAKLISLALNLSIEKKNNTIYLSDKQ